MVSLLNINPVKSDRLKTSILYGARGFLAPAIIALSLVVPLSRAAQAAPVAAKPEANAPVTITDNGRTWTLDNGIVKAVINKRNGDMNSLFYQGHRHHGP